MASLTEPLAWYPLTPYRSTLAPELHFLCFDQAKTNLFYLVEPRIDVEGARAAYKNPIAESINNCMDKATRSHLLGMPLAFMAYWRTVDKGDLALVEGWPSNYLSTMQRRAEAAQARMLGIVEEGNVIRVNFRRDRRNRNYGETR